MVVVHAFKMASFVNVDQVHALFCSHGIDGIQLRVYMARYSFLKFSFIISKKLKSLNFHYNDANDDIHQATMHYS